MSTNKFRNAWTLKIYTDKDKHLTPPPLKKIAVTNFKCFFECVSTDALGAYI